MAARDRGIDDAHEIVVVVTGVVVVDEIGKFLAVRVGSPRIAVDDDIAGGCVELIFGGEHRPVTQIRPPVNLQDQRILLLGIEVGRQ